MENKFDRWGHKIIIWIIFKVRVKEGRIYIKRWLKCFLVRKIKKEELLRMDEDDEKWKREKKREVKKEKKRTWDGKLEGIECDW